LEEADGELPWTVTELYPCVMMAGSTFLISMVTVPWVLLILPIVVYASYLISFKNIPVFKEMNRIESVTKSPLLQLVQETVAGASTIRAFNRQEYYLQRNRKLLNDNILANMYSTGVQNWMNIRLDILLIFIMAVVCSFAIMAKKSQDPVLLSLMVSYTLLLNGYLLAMIRIL
jgi:ABC-type multidrug transport system fused ATPase/permease subunit